MTYHKLIESILLSTFKRYPSINKAFKVLAHG
jgi:hypothetical protein